jgi:tRNA G10  N-methylase Trm11
MNSYIFILGRQPEIGLAELSAVYGQAESITPQVALINCPVTPDINRLGGTRKMGRIIYDDDLSKSDKFLVEHLKQLPSGKITLGVSHYGRGVSSGKARKVGVDLKKRVNRSVRVLPNSSSEIADAASLGNKLGKSPNKVELLMVYLGHRLVVAELIGVQNLNAYTFRDRSRPKRDARVGMLPPKLAQIMINLAAGQSSSGTLLDPFCGTGVVLQEAALIGFTVYGTDLEPRMIDYTTANLTWLEAKYHLDLMPRLEIGDATSHKWHKPLDFIVCETYLGQPYASIPSPEQLQKNITTCNIIIDKFFKNLRPQIDAKTSLCVAVPVWFLNGKTYHLPVVRKLAELGYQTSTKPLIYARSEQIVGRELLVLAKQS